jgi:hypothetical protein
MPMSPIQVRRTGTRDCFDVPSLPGRGMKGRRSLMVSALHRLELLEQPFFHSETTGRNIS